MTTLLRAFVAATIACTASARARDVDITQGCLRTTVEGDDVELPLKHTHVEAEVSGVLSRVIVKQTFANPYDTPIEAIYVFPLPNEAAVNDMQIKIGDRIVRGVIKKREEARRIYDDAKRAGKTAALLDQERPNIFSQSVANIMPGQDIEVQITYDEVLEYTKGRYEFVFPMVVGPRFIAPSTDPADAARISPPVLKPGERNGHDISLTLTIRAGFELHDVSCPTHDIEVTGDGATRTVKLSAKDAIPNKDFVLRYRVGSDKPTFASLAHKEGETGYTLLMFQPPEMPKPETVTPKEMVFVVDCSGSMNGEPIALAKQAMRHALKNLNADDTFQVIRFSETASPFSPTPLPATAENVRRGLSYINDLHGEGGTMMIEGIKTALDYPLTSNRLRIVCFMTDGYIGNESEILAAIEKKLGDNTRLFSFGVGSSVNRYLLDSMAAAGRGHVQYITLGEKPDEQVEAFYARVRNPLLTHIRIDWGNLEVDEVSPGRLRDLFEGEPIFLTARYKRSGNGTVTVHGKINGVDESFPLQVTLPAAEEGNGALASLWARSRIEELERQNYGSRRDDVVDAVTTLALEHRLMSQYTSFVAVEEKVVNEDGKIRTIQVPVEMPEGVSYGSVFGEETFGAAYPAAPAAVSGVLMSRMGGGFVAESPARSRRDEGSMKSVTLTNGAATDEDTSAQEIGNLRIEWIVMSIDGARRVVTLTETGELRVQEFDAKGSLVKNEQVTRLTLEQLARIRQHVTAALAEPETIVAGPEGSITVSYSKAGATEATTRTMSSSGTVQQAWKALIDELKQLSS